MTTLAAASTFSSSPLWYLTRSTGITAFVLLTLTTVLGIAATQRALASPAWPRFATQQLHRNVSLLAMVLAYDDHAGVPWAVMRDLVSIGALFFAYDRGLPISSGRLELAPGKAFAGLYGGGTRPDYQGRGVYRALVAARAAEARRRGHRYLTVDARETSRPILQRLGFQPLGQVRDWVLPAAGETRS